MAAAAFSQTASEKPSVDVRRVGARIACQCGCKDSVATCSMLECHFSKPAKERIAQMQSVGMSDGQIIQAFVREYGAAVYLAPPNAWGWITAIIGAAQLFAGFSLWSGGLYGRLMAILFASLSALAALLSIPAYPFWSLAIFAIDIVIIYGLATYGGQGRTA